MFLIYQIQNRQYYTTTMNHKTSVQTATEIHTASKEKKKKIDDYFQESKSV